MSDTVITNWFGDIVSHPQVVVEATSVDDIAAVLTNPGKYPSPVRAVGCNHSTTPCGAADGGTLIKFHHIALGVIPDDHRQGMQKGWNMMHTRVRERAESKARR